MWQTPEGARPKLPMPPPVFVPSWRHAPLRGDIERMLSYVDSELEPGMRDRVLTLKYETLFAVGFTLFLMTLATNFLSQALVRRFREEYD